MPLDDKDSALLAHVNSRWTADLAFLERMVRINSGSGNLAGIEAVGDLVEPAFAALGFTTRWHTPARGHQRPRAARSLVARRPAKRSGAPVLFMTAHLDTVFEPEDGFEGFVVDGARAVGPGIVDCKGGVALMISAISALTAAGIADRVELRVVLGGDEETGSHESREIIETSAAGSAWSLVFEGGRPNGDIVSYRAGNGGYDLEATGKASHAGNAHQDGVNAIEALAHAIVEVQKLTDYAKGLTVNVGTVHGGAKRNIVPASASAQVDVRYARAADGPPLDAAIRAIAARETVKGATVVVGGGLNRPPYPPDDPRIAALAASWIAAAADVGVAENAGPTGGGSDGNWTAAMGIPTLDGLGPVGGKYHTVGEYLVLDTLPQRAGVCAVAIRRLLETVS